MYELNFSLPYNNLNGEAFFVEEKKQMLNEIIGNALVSTNKGEALKFYDWAVRLHKGDVILVDKSDLKKIRDFIEDSETMFILCKAQLLKIIDEAKEK